MSVVLSLWFLWCVLGGVSLIFALRSIVRWLLAATSEEVEPDIDRLDWKAFEVYVAQLFADLGYRAQLTQDGPDFGADVILERDNTRTAVQAKQYGHSVGVEAIQQVVAAKAVYDCSEAKVVTTSLYTRQALFLAEKNKVEVWDRSILFREIAARQARRRAARLQAQALHCISSMSALLITGVLLSCGLAGFWRQGVSGWQIPLASQPIGNSTLSRAVDPEADAASEVLDPAAGMIATEAIATEAIATEEACGSAVVGIVAALAIREAPSLQSVAVGEVPQGRRIKLICEPTVSTDGISWQLVDYGVGQGWMSRKYLLIEQP